MISYVITAKGRKSHISQSIPRLIAINPTEVILVDYNCPDGTGEWVAKTFPSVNVIFINNADTFHLAKARNIGAKVVTNDWICFLDADVLLNQNFELELASSLHSGLYFRPCQEVGLTQNYSLHGTFVCEKSAFDSINGYDEVIKNWGDEDTDLYQRLDLLGKGRGTFPAYLISSIDHDDSVRTEYYTIKSRSLSQAINRTYVYAKRLLLVNHGLPELPLTTRNNLMETVVNAYNRVSVEGGSFLVEIRSDSINPWVPSPYKLSQDLVIRFVVSLGQP